MREARERGEHYMPRVAGTAVHAKPMETRAKTEASRTAPSAECHRTAIGMPILSYLNRVELVRISNRKKNLFIRKSIAARASAVHLWAPYCLRS